MHNDKVVLIEDIEREPDKTIQYKFEGKISELEDCTVDAELEIKSLGAVSYTHLTLPTIA